MVDVIVVHRDDVTSEDAWQILRQGFDNGDDCLFLSISEFVSKINN